VKFAARITDPHTCPQQAPAPHVGGPVVGPGATTVEIEHLAGCVVGDTCTCAAGAPDPTFKASTTVMYEGKFAVRVGDPTGHGGVIVKGAARVQVGD